jgi:carbon-monoxide dehydrogenase large subunit
MANDYNVGVSSHSEEKPYVGRALRRDEDIRFLTGRAQYTDDIVLPRTAFVAFVRSPHAHARLNRVSVEGAKKLRGVLTVLTAADWKAAKLGHLPCLHPVPSQDGKPMNEITRPIFCEDKVRYVGDTVAAVVAETAHQAQDAAEAVNVEYSVLPSIVDPAEALTPGVPILHEEFGTNLVHWVEHGDKARTDAAFKTAHHITELMIRNTRVCGNAMEPRAYLAQYDSASRRYTLWGSIQDPHLIRRALAKYILREPEHRIRVVAPDVGGGFGPKAYCYPEMAVVLWVAKLLSRPVQWTATRSEVFLSDSHARDFVVKARMAFATDGRILGLECDMTATAGAYQSTFGALIPSQYLPPMLTGLYRTPTAYVKVHGVYTNTAPVDAYRGSIQTPTTINERLIDNGARELGIEPAEMRLRNYIQAHEYPYRAPLGPIFESGNPPGQHELLMKSSNYHELRREQQKLRNGTTRMGIGLAGVLESAGMGPTRSSVQSGAKYGTSEAVSIRVHSDGNVSIFVGTHSHGQSHDITYRQVAADALGLGIENISVHQGDTDQCPGVLGTGAARSLSVAGAAIVEGSKRIITKATKLAVHTLECDEADLEYSKGTFTIKGTDRRILFSEVAEIAHLGGDYPASGLELGLEETVYHDPISYNFPTALHLAVVLLDMETGTATLRDYYCVDDCGRVVNPMVVHGQVHGGAAQGIGQALTEQVVYDSESGQLITGTLMDYCIPRADDLPSFIVDFQETLNPKHVLGVKGCSESGTCGPTAAIGNAIIDALWDFGVRHIQHPYTPERIWRAIHPTVDEMAHSGRSIDFAPKC